MLRANDHNLLVVVITLLSAVQARHVQARSVMSVGLVGTPVPAPAPAPAPVPAGQSSPSPGPGSPANAPFTASTSAGDGPLFNNSGLVSTAVKLSATATLPGYAGVQAFLATDIKGSDLDCGQGGPACRICGEATLIASRCREVPSCVAFSWDESCGYLKTSTGPQTYREGYTVFVLADKTPTG